MFNSSTYPLSCILHRIVSSEAKWARFTGFSKRTTGRP